MAELAEPGAVEPSGASKLSDVEATLEKVLALDDVAFDDAFLGALLAPLPLAGWPCSAPGEAAAAVAVASSLLMNISSQCSSLSMAS